MTSSSSSSSSYSSAIFILSILLLSTISTACPTCSPAPKPKPKPKPTPKPCPPPAVPTPTPAVPTPTPAVPTPTPAVPTPTPAKKSCPKDTLKLGVCADLLGLVNIVVGTPSSSKCCALLDGLTNLDAALCLCTAIKANVLGINLNVPITLELLINACGKSVPQGFKCAS